MYADDPNKFTINMEHNGFFCGLSEKLEYVSISLDNFDNCSTETFSLLWIHDFIRQAGHEVTEKTTVYWCPPGTDITDGVCLVENNSHIVAMLEAVKNARTLCLVIDHTNFVRVLREHCIVPIPGRYRAQGAHKENPAAAVSATISVQSRGQAGSVESKKRTEVDVLDEDGESDEDFYDSNGGGNLASSTSASASSTASRCAPRRPNAGGLPLRGGPLR
jgi:hypothetical protein